MTSRGKTTVFPLTIEPLPPPRPSSFETMKEFNDIRLKEFVDKRSDESAVDVLYAQFAPPNPPKTSSRFNSQDAEITVISSDNVLFRLHKMNVQVTSGNLIRLNKLETNDFLTLVEPAEVLEILFEFLYPDFETDLERLEFDALLSVAEAAEKYGVFYAMSHCTFCLRKHSSSHPAELLRFAVRYRKERMLAELTPALLDMELDEIINILPPTAFGEFCLFRDKWMKVLLKSTALIIETSIEHDQNKNYPCSKDPQTQVARRLKTFFDNAIAKPSLLLNPERLSETFSQLEAILVGNGCAWCKDAFETFKESILDEVKNLPQNFAVELY
ncbi:hypothetical protein EV361DRAFT_955277 [Lentinula raphanica]|uniref:BTB domain-containing protein n=1 Tax=Lentinula raphanica TaxID=153919 RepID=A0AA38P3W3_9AGAR|nr:hypothetical protein C8R42DRAFT_331615 [Lentinula raphanica]KAJ3771648.1 hypothetical protein FB446DRAFT_789394 [Lentinula raphanica]KAJ3822744.1 hypothetical protein F5880DRAFT_632255 [Lentinula raphanica]KAJ3835588.1 hypothetical protein F5878DRAFT_566942 [Lentinula raphanica]KAJ3965155.1 hypothetical protein EV361DRAFT_955277 [Lentinula raphanica]